MGKGFNTFRIPFLMERLVPPATGITGPLDATYLAGLKTVSLNTTNSIRAHRLTLLLKDCQLHHWQGWLCPR